MASRILGAGNILGYLSGYLNLKKHLSFFGNTQFKILCVIASAALAGFVLLSSAAIQERDPRLEGPATKGTGGVLTFFKNVFKSINRLPPQTRKVCRVQFFAWIGFFPQLFYSSSYVGDIYIQPFLRENPNMTPAEMDHLYEKATRIGTYALLCNAIVAVSTNVFLPFLIAPSYDAPAKTEASDSKLQAFLHMLIIPGLTLRRAWLGSHVVFALAMFSTLIVTSVNGATILIALIGIPWALTLWAPFAIISAEISKRDALRRARNTSNEAEDDVDQAGVILGIHNMAVTMPQIIATLASSVAFKFLQKPRGTPGDHSFAYVLAAGGVSTLVAAWLTSRIQDEVPTTEEGLLEEGDADHAPRSSSERPLMGNELARGMRDDGL